MASRLRSLLILLVLLVPAGRFAWRNADMPQFAYLHDDGVLVSSAKSLAAGDGYVVASLPERPAQTKYPPLFPLLISMIWRFDGAFPANLGWISAACWLVLAAYLGIAVQLFRSFGFGEAKVWGLTLLLAINPYLVLFGTMPFAEVFYSCWVMLALLAARRKSPGAQLRPALCLGLPI